MDIKRFELYNIGRFERLNIKLATKKTDGSNVTIFIGNNGSGKTTILESLIISMSWFVARVRSRRSNVSTFSKMMVKNDTDGGGCSIDIDYKNNNYNFIIKESKRGKNSEHGYRNILNELTQLVGIFREKYTQNSKTSLPLIALYPVERIVDKIGLKIYGGYMPEPIDGYDIGLSKGVDFEDFFEWFRLREDIENEKIRNLFAHGLLPKKEKLTKEEDTQLKAVRKAIKVFIPEFDNLRVYRNPLSMLVDKNGEELDVNQLSQGEKSLMALVGDIARRLAIMNPALENPLEGDGIVLIDEVDMHLHPQWQRKIVNRLSDTFPNCQFVLTTHSPLVISDPKEVLVYELNNGEITKLESLYGEDVNSVLLGTMNTDIRNATVEKAIDNILNDIGDGKLQSAKQKIQQLKSEISENNSELQRLHFLLRRKELLHEKNK